MAKKKKPTFLKSKLSFIRSLGTGTKALLFIAIFGLVGGSGYLVFNSYAASASIKSCSAKYDGNPYYLKQGMYNNSCAKSVQNFLKTAGYGTTRTVTCLSRYQLSSPLVADGDFGGETKKAVQCYQYTKANLAGWAGPTNYADGIIGPDTWRWMLDTCRGMSATNQSRADCY